MCSSCEMAKEYMKLRKISFSEKNVSTDLDAQVEINKLGFDTTPIIVIGNKIIDGFDVVKKDLISIFKKNEIIPIECIDKKFDPNFHQAMLEVENSTKEAGTVVQEVQKGYMMKDRLLRPSLVGVAKKPIKKGDKK